MARQEEASAFLSRATDQPSGLVIYGPMGIGKTTMWSSAVDRARHLGFQVLSARAVQAESVLAYAVVADLLSAVDPGVLDALPAVQRLAVDRVLLNERADGRATDQRVTAAAFSSIVERLADHAPVLIAIDDVQWLDTSSRGVIGFAARRATRPVGFMVTERTVGELGSSSAGWLQMGDHGVETVRVAPMSFGGVHAMILQRLGRSFPRTTLAHVYETSGGNPFYAMELARAVDASGSGSDALPATLAELTQLRLAHLDDAVRETLLAASCVADPTVEVIAAAIGRPADDVVAMLEVAEGEGVVVIEGNRVRFEHPMLSYCTYTLASPAARRRMHRALAQVEVHPELRARHLALGTTTADRETLKALDAAAEAASARGAPAASAELFQLAIQRGGDTPMRRFRAAASLLAAGDATAGRAMLEPAIDATPQGPIRAAALNLLAGLCVYTNGYAEATAHLERALPDAADNPLLRVQTLLMLSFTQINDGAFAESLRNSGLAVEAAERLDLPALTSQVLSMSVMVNCVCGNGVDEAANSRALALEDPTLNAPIVFRASANNSQLLAWKGDLDAARDQITEVRRRCEERGAESDLLFVAVQNVLIEIWRGDLKAARTIARDAAERAELDGGDQSLLIATTVQAAVAAYRGRVDSTRAHARRALDAAERCGAHRVAEWPTMMLGFLETSLGNYVEALGVLEGLIAQFPTTPVGTELITATFIPDAVEAMLALGRCDDAEPLIAALEANGSRLDRPWMIAVGARCRAMAFASRGDVSSALASSREALTAHDRLAMPFERARTQLVHGQLLRRARHKGAGQTFRDAVEAFAQIGATVWESRAHDELARTNVSRTDGAVLTPAERRVAERAVQGLSNREIAAALNVSVKTVEANLSSVYRKLGIRSRAQLAGLSSTALT